jgi:hypothetical protein
MSLIIYLFIYLFIYRLFFVCLLACLFVYFLVYRIVNGTLLRESLELFSSVCICCLVQLVQRTAVE